MFLKCDHCGHTIELSDKYIGSKCRSCKEGQYRQSKDIYIVNYEADKDVLESAFKMMGFTGYEIAVMTVDNTCMLYPDEMVFASQDKSTWNITEELRNDYRFEHIEEVFEFFSRDFSQYDRVIVCHTGNICSRLMLYVMAYKFEKEGLELYHMNLTIAGQYMQSATSSSIYYNTDTCPICRYYDYAIATANPAELIDEVNLQSEADRWKRLLLYQTGLCICEGWEIINVPETMYDNLIIDVVSNNKGRNINFLVAVAAAAVDSVRSAFIQDRIEALIEEGKINLDK